MGSKLERTKQSTGISGVGLKCNRTQWDAIGHNRRTQTDAIGRNWTQTDAIADAIEDKIGGNRMQAELSNFRLLILKRNWQLFSVVKMQSIAIGCNRCSRSNCFM